MITHALARNIVVPFFMALYFVKRYDTVKVSKIYEIFSWASYILLPTYIVLILFGVKPVSWFLTGTWQTNHSILQYLVYIPLTLSVIYQKTKDHALSFNLAFMSATSAGYLYEIPYWIRRGGILEIIRTAKTSFVILDFGMLAVIYLVFMLRWYKIKLDKRLALGISIYLIYLSIYWAFYPQRFIELYYITRIPTAVFLRLPAMILTYIATTNIIPRSPEPKRDRLYYFHENT